MKHLVKILAVALLVALSPFSLVQAGKAAPGIQKKVPPTISNVVVSFDGGAATISWETSVPTYGSVLIRYELDAVGLVDPKFGTHHEVTVSHATFALGYEVQSFSEKFGSAESVSGTF